MPYFLPFFFFRSQCGTAESAGCQEGPELKREGCAFLIRQTNVVKESELISGKSAGAAGTQKEGSDGGITVSGEIQDTVELSAIFPEGTEDGTPGHFFPFSVTNHRRDDVNPFRRQNPIKEFTELPAKHQMDFRFRETLFQKMDRLQDPEGISQIMDGKDQQPLRFFRQENSSPEDPQYRPAHHPQKTLDFLFCNRSTHLLIKPLLFRGKKNIRLCRNR